MQFADRTWLGLAVLLSWQPLASGQSAFALRHVSEKATHQIRLVDVNHDGRADLIAGAHNQQSLLVALGDGQGAFGAEFFVPGMLCDARDIATGDFDGNGHLDIAVAMAPTCYGILVYLGDGTGQFAPGIAVSPTPTAACLAAADLDFDGDDDLVWGDILNSLAVVQLATGAGSFAPGVSYQLSTGPLDMVLGRFNADTRPDILVTGTSDTECLLGGPNGTFQAPTQATNIRFSSLATVDFDFDGKLDFAGVWTGAFQTYCFKGNGLGGFSPHSFFPGGYDGQVVTGDINGDGRADLLFTDPSAKSVHAHFANGSGFGAGSNYPLGVGPPELAAADLNGDGRADVVTSSSAGVAVLLPSSPLGRLEIQTEITIARPCVADFDLDGFPDLVGAGGGGLQFLRGQGSGNFQSPVTIASGFITFLTECAQLDSGTAPDVVSLDYFNKKARVLLGDGSGAFPTGQQLALPGTPIRMGFADLESDGDMDFVVFCVPDTQPGQVNQTVPFFNNGAGIFQAGPSLSGPPSGSLLSMLVGNFDADTLPDLAFLTQRFAGPASTDIQLAFATAPGVWGAPITTQVLNTISSSAGFSAGDADADGDLDLWVAGPNGVGRMHNNGAGSFAPFVPVVSAPAGVQSIEFSLIDFDTIPDMLLTGFGPAFSLARGTATGFAPLESFGWAGSRVRIADINADGRPDVVAATNTGTGPNWVSVALNLLNQVEPPTVYCTAKTISLGCLPQISFTGTPSASASSGFVVSASNILNQKVGLMIYSVAGRAAVPFGGGVFCIKTPIKRAIAVNSGGSPLPLNCSGVYSLDFNAFARGLLGGNPLGLLNQAGVLVGCQWWGRDPGFVAPNNVTLSDALEFALRP